MPGIAIGAVARKPRTRQPATACRVVTYAMTSAIAVPIVAAAVPRITVFFSARDAADRSNNTKYTLCSVKFCKVRNVEATGENAALNKAAYGRNTGLSNTSRHSANAGQRQPCNGMIRGAPYFPPTTE